MLIPQNILHARDTVTCTDDVRDSQPFSNANNKEKSVFYQPKSDQARHSDFEIARSYPNMYASSKFLCKSLCQRGPAAYEEAATQVKHSRANRQQLFSSCQMRKVWQNMGIPRPDGPRAKGCM